MEAAHDPNDADLAILGLGELVEQVLHRRAHALLLATTRPCRRLASKLAQIRLLIVVEAHGAGERDED
jgi:hypothetical protein